MKKLLISISLVFGLLSPAYFLAEDASHLYSTGSILEFDRCASAWLIKRFIDPKAEFKFFPDGEFIKEGIAFDTPDAGLFRTHSRATFEVIMEKYGIKDQKIVQLAEYIHDIEINFWGKKQNQESLKIDTEINQIIRSAKNNAECLKKCFLYFDHFLKN
jgi:hypothetical protein